MKSVKGITLGVLAMAAAACQGPSDNASSDVAAKRSLDQISVFGEADAFCTDASIDELVEDVYVKLDDESFRARADIEDLGEETYGLRLFGGERLAYPRDLAARVWVESRVDPSAPDCTADQLKLMEEFAELERQKNRPFDSSDAKD